jgi:phage anti-repressor protein
MSAEKENTFRMLREEELLVTFWGCRIGWHKWTKYREPEKYKESYYEVVSQQRRCGSCNKADRRIISRFPD